VFRGTHARRPVGARLWEKSGAGRAPKRLGFIIIRPLSYKGRIYRKLVGHQCCVSVLIVAPIGIAPNRQPKQRKTDRVRHKSGFS
jgi:hypothetical protein